MEKLGLYIVSILLLLYGLIELYPLITLKKDNKMHQRVRFIFEPLQTNKEMTYMLGSIFGLLRIIAGIGIFMNLMWGLALGIILSIVTLIIMTFYLPAGVFDGVISTIILVILLMTYFGSSSII